MRKLLRDLVLVIAIEYLVLSPIALKAIHKAQSKVHYVHYGDTFFARKISPSRDGGNVVWYEIRNRNESATVGNTIDMHITYRLEEVSYDF